MPSSRGSSQPRTEARLLHCRWILYQLNYQGSLPFILNPHNMLLELQGPLHPTLHKSQLPSVPHQHPYILPLSSQFLHHLNSHNLLLLWHSIPSQYQIMCHSICLLYTTWNPHFGFSGCTWPRSLRCSCYSCHRLPETPAPFISPPQLPSPPLVLSNLPVHTRTHASLCQILFSSFLQPLRSSHHAQLQTHWIVCILHSLLPFGNNHKKYRLAKPGINSWVLIVPFSTVVISRLCCFSRFFYPTAFSSLSACGLTFFWGKIKACFNDHYLTMPSIPGGASGKKHARQCRTHKRCDLDPWVGKIPWRKVWQPTPIFWSGGSPWTEESGRLQYMGSRTWLKQPSTQNLPSNLKTCDPHVFSLNLYHRGMPLSPWPWGQIPSFSDSTVYIFSSFLPESPTSSCFLVPFYQTFKNLQLYSSKPKKTHTFLL